MTTSESATQFWSQAQQALAEKVELNDFAFLEGLLSPTLLAALKEILVLAASKETFPDVQGLSRYLEEKGHKPWKLTELKNRGFVLNTQPSKAGGGFATIDRAGGGRKSRGEIPEGFG